MSQGVKWVAADRSQAVPDNGFSGRASRALRNNLESAAMWVPVALVAIFRNETSTLTCLPLVYIGRRSPSAICCE